MISAPRLRMALASSTFPRVRPSSSSLLPLAAICSRVRPVRSAVPASLPRMPLLASRPMVAARSSSGTPRFRAIGAAYFSDSPRSSTVWLDLFADWVSTSTTRAVSPVCSPKARRLSAAMLPISSKVMDVASAPRTMPPSASVVSFALNPARLSAVASIATSVGVPAATAATASISLRSTSNEPAPPSIADALRSSASNLPNCMVMPCIARPMPAAANPLARLCPSDLPAFCAVPSTPLSFASSFWISEPYR